MKNSKWNSDNITDQKEKVIIVTGSTSGIGYETARVLAGKNATVILAVRDMKKAETAKNKIKADYANADIRIMALDLASLKSIQSFSDKFKDDFSRLDLLINNAGVMIPPYSKTENGFELQFGTNHLGHFALTGQLLDLLKSTSGSRIVNVSSSAHKFGNIDFTDLHWQKRKYKKWQAYGDSKIANLYFTYELQRKLAPNGANPIVTAAHPGWTATELQRHNGLIVLMNKFFAQTIDMGALPTLYAAIAPDVIGNAYYGPSGFQGLKGYPKKVESNSLSQKVDIAAQLWQESEKLTGVFYNI